MTRSRSLRLDGVPARLKLSLMASLVLIALAVTTACGGDDTDGSTPTATEAGQDGTGTPSDGPSATVPAGARQASLLEDPTAFLDQFSQEILDQKKCGYDETNGVVDCTDANAGLIDLVPDLPASADIECRVLLSKEVPVGLRCSSQDPLFAAIYELEE